MLFIFTTTWALKGYHLLQSIVYAGFYTTSFPLKGPIVEQKSNTTLKLTCLRYLNKKKTSLHIEVKLPVSHSCSAKSALHHRE